MAADTGAGAGAGAVAADTGAGAGAVAVDGANTDYMVRGRRLPFQGPPCEGDIFLEGPGVKAANQAVAAAWLGARVALVGRLGADARGEGVELPRSVRDAEACRTRRATPCHRDQSCSPRANQVRPLLRASVRPAADDQTGARNAKRPIALGGSDWSAQITPGPAS